jgi:hypothetical protein
MVISPLSFSATENLRKKLMAMNLNPYFVKDSSSPLVNPEDVGTKETNWVEIPLKNQEDIIDTGILPQAKLNILNQYGPETGRGPQAIFKNLGTKSNEGEFEYQTGQTNKLTESKTQQKELLVLNRFAPQQGWTDSASEFESEVIEPQIRDEYVSDSTKPNLFRPSTYSAAELYIKKDPIGSDGPLSQDSLLAQISAIRLKSLFLESVAYEIQTQTSGRANALIAAKDPYLASKILTGRSPLIEPNWQVTAPDSALGQIGNFVARITGVYTPFSYIPGDYFNTVQPTSFLNQTINTVAGVFGFPNVLPTRKTSSDIFLAYTGQGTRKLLFGALALNKFAPDYKANFINNLGIFAPKGNYYIGSRTSEPLNIVSPSGQVPLDEYGREIETNVYGPSTLGKLYENEIDFNFGLNSTSTTNGGGLQGGFTWVSPKYKANAGFQVGQGGDPKQFDQNFQPIGSQFSTSESTNFSLKRGSILDDTQRLINSQPTGGRKLQHVGNAIDQVSKVFNDGYKEITKGSRVIKYTDQNGVFVGSEYGRVFAKDIPYYANPKLVKTDGNIRKNPDSIFDKTYNLNMFPTTGPDSTSIVDGRVKKYMLSIENLAWRTSRRPGLTYADLPESEKGPNGGRIMWFPPYALSFDDKSTVNWDPNTFLGRPEEIYTYKSTSRAGSLNFKMIVDHPSVMNMVVNQVLSNANSSELADKVLESFFAGLTKFDVYELAKKYPNFNPAQIQELQDLINNSSNPEKIKDAVNSNLNRGGDGAGGSMTSNSSVGIQDYKPKLTGYIGKSQFYFDYNQSGGNSYNDSLNAYENANQFSTIIDTQRSEIEASVNILQNLGNEIKNILSTNANVTINLVLKANSSSNEASSIKESRNTCIEQTILRIVGSNPNFSITKTTGADDDVISPQTEKCNTPTTTPYDVVPVACRRVVIQDIKETPLPNITNPNGGTVVSPATVVSNVGTQTRLASQLNRAATNSASNLGGETISKKVLRGLLNESNYFQFVKESNPFVYDSLREKLKFFHPAFHSSTPEGLNSRMTFLLQCTRPGDTIPTKQADGTLIDKDARNTSFGAPPVCVIRIGDIYHTKAIVESVSFGYGGAEAMTYDLNPEGIGVQPMIVDVTISFKFIGGQSLKGPIDELQNALSFNFFANTEMYDERATVLDTSAYDKEFIEQTEPTGDTARNTNTDLINEAGEFIGKLEGELQVSGTTGQTNYQVVVESLIDSFEELFDGTYDKLKQINDNYNWVVLQIYNSQRQYSTGKLNGEDKTIFGKSQNYQTNLERVFTDLLSDIDNETLSLFNATKVIFEKEEETVFKNVFKTQLKNLVENKKATFFNELDTITSQLSEVQLKYTRVIDKLNFLSNQADGIIDKTGIPKIYTTTTTATITDLMENTKSIANASGILINDLISSGIIEDQGENYDFSKINAFYYKGGDATDLADKRFVTVFGQDLHNNYKELETKIIGELTQKPYKERIENNMKTSYGDFINDIFKQANAAFKKSKDSHSKASKTLPDNWNSLRKQSRESGILIQTNPTSEVLQEFQQLYSGVNIDDNTFNSKFTF